MHRGLLHYQNYYFSLQGKIELHSLKEGKADSDPIEYF